MSFSLWDVKCKKKGEIEILNKYINGIEFCNLAAIVVIEKKNIEKKY